jgi:KUP system potassium uptake protein
MVNWGLYVGCVGIVLFFNGESGQMEAAYGLAITLTMLATTTLLSQYLRLTRMNTALRYSLLGLYFVLEGAFLYANLHKFNEGGWVSLAVGAVLFGIMWVWIEARKVKDKYQRMVPLSDYLPQFIELSKDTEVPKTSTHLVYLTSSRQTNDLDDKIVYSIFRKQPKRADIYWFVHVQVEDEPYRMDYKVNIIEPDDVIRVDFYLGFRVQPRINLFYRKVVEEMVRNGEVNITSRYNSLSRYNFAGDFKFVLLERFLSYDYELPLREKMVMNLYFLFKNLLSISDERSYGLDTSSVTVEKVPLAIGATRPVQLNRLDDPTPESA